MNLFDILLAVVLLAMTVAIVGLFAMMGELNSRVTSSPADDGLQAIDDANVGGAVEVWPDALGHVAEQEEATLLVFSTSCRTCTKILDGETGPLPSGVNISYIVVCPDATTGRTFAEKHGLGGDHRPTMLDIGGDWTKETIGVAVSPSVVTVRRGVIESADIFTSSPALSRLNDRTHV